MVSPLIKICHVLQCVLVEYVALWRPREVMLSIWVISGPKQGILYRVNGVE